MPTTYTADPTASETGDTAPAPEKVPVLTVPIATDGRTVSSILSAYRNLANHVAWLFKPKAASGVWAQWIMAYRSALGHKRFLIDHLGLPAGRIQQWNERWDRGIGWSGALGPLPITGNAMAYNADLTSQLVLAGLNLTLAGTAANFTAAQTNLLAAGTALTTAAGDVASVGELGAQWRGKTVQGSGTSSINFLPPVASYSYRHSTVALHAGDTAGDYANIWSAPNVAWDNDLTFYLEWEAQLEAANTVTDSIGLGLSIPNTLTVGGSPAAHFAAFVLAPGGGNWFCQHAGGAGGAGVDSGVAASTNPVRFRIEFHGANVADNATRTLRYYINGTQVGGDITTDIPGATQMASAAFCCVNTGGGAAGLLAPIRIGPARFAANIYGADVQ